MTARSTIQRAGGAAAALALGLLAALPAAAHQTFLIADIYQLKPGTDNFLILKNGTYYESGYSITRKMSRDISLVMGGARKTPPDEEVRDVDSNPSYKSTYIKVFAEKAGTGLGGLAAIPDYIALPAEMFAEYLEHEGLTDAHAEFKANNKLGTIRERYTKHAKAVFQVGDAPLSDDYRQVLGYKAEIFLDQHPGKVKVGEEMGVQVLFEGKPLKNQILYVSHASRGEQAKATVAQNSLYTLRTDENGRAKFRITAKDKWFVQMIHMQKLVNDEDADYESNWSTITFAVL
jgi:hypothetical protein